MIIGIDGGMLGITDERLKVGVYRLVSNLVKQLLEIDGKNNYRIYTFGRVEQGRLTAENLKVVKLPGMGFQRVWLPLSLIRQPVDIYLGLSQNLPKLPPQTLCDINTIGFIYDLGFLHHPEAYPASAKRLKNQTVELVKRAGQIITISHATAQDLIDSLRVDKDKITVCYPGIDPVFTLRGPRYQPARPYFLFVGSLKRGKNIPMMLKAYSQIVKKLKPPYDFLLVGSNYWLDPEIQATIEALGLRKRVKIMGFVDDKHLASYYRGAVALVSVSRIEGFGLPAIEAMACGCPVIGSTSGSYPEIVGKAGILVDPDDIAGVAEAMVKISKDVALRRQLIVEGRKRAKLFTWRRTARQVLEVINQITNHL